MISYKVNTKKMSVDISEGFSVKLATLCGTIQYSVSGISSEIKEKTSSEIEVFSSDLAKIGTLQIITVKS